MEIDREIKELDGYEEESRCFYGFMPELGKRGWKVRDVNWGVGDVHFELRGVYFDRAVD